MRRRQFQIIILVFLLLGFSVSAFSQYKIRGIVYDSTHNIPMAAVTVLSTSGKGTITNSNGEYEIEVAEKDSIWFSYLNKPTVKFPVLTIANPFGFDISLKVSVPVLKEVTVRQRDYRQDSIANRETYAKIFNYQKPKLKAVTPSYGVAAGFDVNEIINAFRFKRNKSIQSFQKRLLQQERDKSVQHRFNKGLVVRLTGLKDAELDSFMTIFRPPYFFVMNAAEYDFQKYIKDSYERFKKGLGPLVEFKPEDEEEFF